MVMKSGILVDMLKGQDWLYLAELGERFSFARSGRRVERRSRPGTYTTEVSCTFGWVLVGRAAGLDRGVHELLRALEGLRMGQDRGAAGTIWGSHIRLGSAEKPTITETGQHLGVL
jgi:hypothetical protein